MAKGNGVRKNPLKKPVVSGVDRLTRSGLIPGNPGNSGGKPGRSGRPTKAFKKFCRELAASEEYQEAIKTAATSASHENFIGAAKLVATFATSKPAKQVNHIHTSSARDRLAERLARLAERN
jgi:hypothetical protein